MGTFDAGIELPSEGAVHLTIIAKVGTDTEYRGWRIEYVDADGAFVLSRHGPFNNEIHARAYMTPESQKRFESAIANYFPWKFMKPSEHGDS